MISSTSSYLSAQNNGFAGLASGMDTQSLVEQMLAPTKTKIESQNSAIATLELKQQLYRDSITTLQNFQSSFFDVADPSNNIRSSSFWSQNTTSLNDDFSKFFTANALDSYKGSGVTVDYISQLATASSVTTAGALTTGSVSATLNTSTLLDTNMTLTINVPNTSGGDSVKTEVTVNAVGLTAESLVSAINSATGDAGAKINEDTGAIEFADGVTVSQTDVGGLAKAYSGFSSSGSSITLSPNASPDYNDVNYTLYTTLDGINKNITLSLADLTGDANALADNISSQLSNAYGNGVSVNLSGGTLTFETSDSGRQFTLSGDNETTEALGIYSGASTKMSLDANLSDISFSSGALQQAAGGGYKFSINGQDFEFDADASLRDVMNAVNSNDAAGVEMTYNSLSNKVTMERTSTGSGFDITMQDDGGNLLSTLFGSGTSSSTTVQSSAKSDILAAEGSDAALTFTFSSSSSYPPISINIAGKSMSDVAEELERLIHEEGDAEAQVSFDESTGRLIITGVSTVPVTVTGSSPEVMNEIFGANEVTMTSEATTGNVTEGKNAVLSLDGVHTERSSNTVNIDGLELTLNSVTEAGADPMDVDVDQDLDATIDNVMKFVEEYNKIVEEFSALLNEPTTYKEYPPLTTEQKSEMTDREIELWEEKAAEGLLRNDDTINSVLSDMRSILYQTPEGAQFALYEFGIETSSDWTENGKLVVDEEQLRKMLTENPGAMESLFVTPENADDDPDKLGLGDRLNNILDDAAKTSSADPGTLVQIAGFTNMATDQYTIGRELEDMQEVIERLEYSYQMESDRYWSEFNAMEQLIADMNSQSSWLASQFS